MTDIELTKTIARMIEVETQLIQLKEEWKDLQKTILAHTDAQRADCARLKQIVPDSFQMFAPNLLQGARATYPARSRFAFDVGGEDEKQIRPLAGKFFSKLYRKHCQWKPREEFHDVALEMAEADRLSFLAVATEPSSAKVELIKAKPQKPS